MLALNIHEIGIVHDEHRVRTADERGQLIAIAISTWNLTPYCTAFNEIHTRFAFGWLALFVVRPFIWISCAPPHASAVHRRWMGMVCAAGYTTQITCVSLNCYKLYLMSNGSCLRFIYSRIDHLIANDKFDHIEVRRPCWGSRTKHRERPAK